MVVYAVLGLLLALAAVPASGGERVPLRAPEFDLRVPTRDYVVTRDPKTGERHRYAWESNLSHDRATGVYVLSWMPMGKTRPVEAVWEPSTRIEVVVRASVRRLEAEALYEYRYQAVCGATSAQPLRRFIVECPGAPASTGASMPGGSWSESELPASVWGAAYHVWSDAPGVTPPRIGAGDTADAFWIRAAGPPAVAKCYASGFSAGIQFHGFAPGEPVEIPYDSPFPSKILDDAVYGLTIGPGRPIESEGFAPDVMIATLRGYVQPASQQGWIVAPADADRFLQRIDEAQHAFEDRDRAKAAGILEGLADEAERMGQETPPRLTEEGVALFALLPQDIGSRLRPSEGDLPVGPARPGGYGT